jgi:hypothetical protein
MAGYRKGDRVFHVATRREGTVYSKPQAGRDRVRVLVDGNIAPTYFEGAELRNLTGEGRAPEVAIAPVLPEKPVPAVIHPAKNGVNGDRFPPVELKVGRGPVPVESNARTEADKSYEGELTLERLFQIRATLQAKMRSLDDRILLLQIEVMAKRALDPVRRNRYSVESRTTIAQEALAIRKELDAALGGE